MHWAFYDKFYHFFIVNDVTFILIRFGNHGDWMLN